MGSQETGRVFAQTPHSLYPLIHRFCYPNPNMHSISSFSLVFTQAPRARPWDQAATAPADLAPAPPWHPLPRMGSEGTGRALVVVLE